MSDPTISEVIILTLVGGAFAALLASRDSRLMRWSGVALGAAVALNLGLHIYSMLSGGFSL